MIVTFMPGNIKEFAKTGDNLLDVAGRAKILIDGSCSGNGGCGKCKVQVIGGKVQCSDDYEKSILTDREINDGYRLACHLKVEDDLCVLVPNRPDVILRKTKLTIMPNNFDAEKYINKNFIEVKMPSLENQRSDVERIFNALSGNEYTMDPSLIVKIPEVLKQNQSNVTVVTRGNDIIALEGGDTIERCFGIAFDIGTTTVVGMLWNLKNEELIGTSAMTNPQSLFGADVISRIHFCSIASGNLNIMKTKIHNCFNEIIEDFRANYEINYNEIYEVTVVGNTTMSHLFLGVNPEQLANAPFVPVFKGPLNIKGRDMELNINPMANIHLLPNIAGHVGSDITGVLLASRIMDMDGLNLAIDVGTNGEIVLCKDGRTLVCSTAAGPAFEGAAIYQGMRAASGAIEGVKIENGEVILDIIDNCDPVGICGSGLIDAAAELFKTGIIDHTGRVADKDNAQKRNICEPLVKRLRKGKSGNEFVLVWKQEGEDIVITQKDIREVQLAKGAIHGGIKCMLNAMEERPENIKRIILAGAFGNYIKKDRALAIGLFPDISEDNIISVGNAAGVGASMALLSWEEREKASFNIRKIEHVELASRPDFQTEYIDAMNFPRKFK